VTRSSGRTAVSTTRSRAVVRPAQVAAAPTPVAAPFAAELREVEYWRRLVLARLDLAVAAVTAAEEPTQHTAPEDVLSARPVPADLRRLIGLGQCDALGEAAVLERLRDALDDLDCYARGLRAGARRACQESARPTS